MEWRRRLAVLGIGKRDAEVKGVPVSKGARKATRDGSVDLLAGRSEHDLTWSSASGFTFMLGTVSNGKHEDHGHVVWKPRLRLGSWCCVPQWPSGPLWLYYTYAPPQQTVQ